MKRLFLLAIVWVSGLGYALATHILGGEITYSWKSDQVYVFYIDLYRDCGECKLSGRGGGSSNKDCGDFNVHLRSSSRQSCTGRDLATFQPKFVHFKKILPTCQNFRTSCDSGSSSSVGAEVHRYTVEIDFSDFSGYSSCGFEVYVKLASRSDELSNVTEQDATFFNYAYIDPVVQHSSPEFSEQADLVLSLNAPVRHQLIRDDGLWDSLAYKMGAPLRDLAKPLTYRSGFSKDHPISVYCASDPDCSPEPDNEPPIGYSLNAHTGELRYTPVQKSEKAVVVQTVEFYRMVSGKPRLVGVIRRDIQQIVLDDFNRAPLISTSSNSQDPFSFEVCEGTELCFNVLAQDNPVLLPDGTPSQQDSVRFEVTFDQANAKIQQIGMGTPPYSYLRFCWKPDSIDVRSEPYKLRIRALDNHCPFNAFSERWIEIRVLRKPEVQIVSNKLSCGNLDVVAQTDQGNFVNFYNWQVVDTIGSRFYGDQRARDTLIFNKTGNYNVLLTVRNKESCSESTSMSVNWTSREIAGPDLVIQGSRNYCEGDTLALSLQEPGGYFTDSIRWFSSGNKAGSKATYIEFPVSRSREGSALLLDLFTRKDGLTCYSTSVIDIQVDTMPVIAVVPFPAVCPQDQLVDLLDYVNPAIGSFTGGTLGLKDGHLLDTREIPNRYLGSTQCFNYQIKSDRSFCTASERLCVNVYPVPELKMRDITSCSYQGSFQLNNMITLPYQLNNFEVTWQIGDPAVSVDKVDDRYWVNLDSLGGGNHEVICELKNFNGCLSRDTARFQLLAQAVIEFREPGIQCQRDDIVLDDLFEVSPEGGGWNSFSHPGFLREGVLSSSVCGETVALNYTYDKFGCFDTRDVELRIRCAPEVTLEPDGDTLCSADRIVLSAKPDGGEWTGPGVSGNIWNTADLHGEVELNYTLSDSFCTHTYATRSFIVPRVSVALDPLPDRVCQGDDLMLTGIEIQRGIVQLTHNGNQYILDEKTRYVSLNQADSLPNWQLDLKQITTSADCPVMGSLKIPVSPRAEFSLEDSLLKACLPFTLSPQPMNLSPGVDWDQVSYFWNFGVPLDPGGTSTGKRPNFTYQKPGIYQLHVETRTEHGCVWNSAPFQVQVFDRPIAYFVVQPGSHLSERNTLATFTNSSSCLDSMTYLWDFGTGSGSRYSTQQSPRFVFPKDTGYYRVLLTAYTGNGCSDEFERLIHITPDILLYVPTGFTPNHLGPEPNEVHRVNGQYIEAFEIWILSRWGDVVYYSNDLEGAWDGTYKGAPCQAGIYAYKIRARSQSNEWYDFAGNITLLR